MPSANASALKVIENCQPVRVIERAIADDRLAHALLIHGEDPAALETLAQGWAAKLVGQNNPASEHPDIHHLRPSGKSRQIRIGKDASDHPSVRGLIHSIQLSTVASPHKVAIIHDVDRMNQAAANAFLKTLEEPPPQTTLFLLSTRPHDLLATIRSRCLHFKIPTLGHTIKHAKWTQWLNDYNAWLDSLIHRKLDRRSVAQPIMTAYGLAARVSSILKTLESESWEEAAQKLALEDPEQEEAARVGHSKLLRRNMLKEIESQTRDFVLQSTHTETPRLTRPLAQSISALEHSARLLEVQFNAEAALEYFLLSSLQFWSRAQA